MWKYSGTVLSITPNTSNDNWTLDADSAGVGKLIETWWGGQATSSTAMATRVARASGGVTPVAGNVAEHGPANQPANQIDFVASWSGSQTTLNAADIMALSWNCHGGVVRWLFDPEDEIWMVTGETLDLIACRNSVGTGTSTYGAIWSEIGV
jgi:hypothetical protein|tara:strand:- start:4923 stop:5378 length:456 start_codon:yes stop_codon:yes gene_type:complete